MHSKTKLFVLIGCTVLFWATAFTGNRFCLNFYTPGELAFIRYVVGCTTLSGLVLCKQVKLANNILIIDYLHFAILGLLGISVYNFFLYSGQLQLLPGLSSLLTNTAPIFTAIFSVLFLKEKISRKGWLGITIGFLGVLIIVTGGRASFELSTGMLWVLGAAISLSTYFVVQKPILKRYTSFEVTFYAMIGGTLLLIPIGYSAILKLPDAPLNIQLTVLYLGIFPGALAYLTWSMVQALLPASRASIFLFLIPLLSYGLSHFVYNEYPEANAISGGICIITGIILFNRFANINQNTIIES